MIPSNFSITVQPHRPFRRQRPNIVGKWCALLKSTVEKTKEFSKCVLGKLVIYSSVELAGSTIGKKCGEYALGYAGARIAVPCAVLSFAWIETRMKTSKVALRLLPLTVLWFAIPSQYSNDYIASIGSAAGELIGRIAGSILGGFAALYLVKCPVVFWDSANPWRSYSVSMVRSHAAGGVFDSLIVTPTIPYLSPILLIPRNLVRSITKTIAFSSSSVISVAKECLQKKYISKQILAPLIVQLIMERFSHPKEPPVTKKIARKIFTTLTSFSTSLEKVLQIGAEYGVQKLVSDKNVSLAVTMVLRSLHQYTQILKNSNEIEKAQKQFYFSFSRETTQPKKQPFETTGLKEFSDLEKLQKKIYSSSGDAAQSKKQLIETMGRVFKIPSSYSKEKIMESFLKDDRLRILPELIVSKIQKLEVTLIGTPLLKKEDASFLEQLIDLYLRHYLLFLIFNLEHFTKELTLTDEEGVILDLHHALLSSYMTFATPSAVSSAFNALTSGALQTAFKTKNLLRYILEPPEQTVFLRHEKNENPNESYFKVVEEPIEKEFVLVPWESRDILEVKKMDNFKMNFHPDHFALKKVKNISG